MFIYNNTFENITQPFAGEIHLLFNNQNNHIPVIDNYNEYRIENTNILK